MRVIQSIEPETIHALGTQSVGKWPWVQPGNDWIKMLTYSRNFFQENGIQQSIHIALSSLTVAMSRLSYTDMWFWDNHITLSSVGYNSV